MNTVRIAIGLGICIALSGCVLGSGPCLWLQVPRDFTGRVHFREFPRADGVDEVPILILDKTEYIYAPPQSLLCLPANDVQLVGITELPDRIGENSHVLVNGKVLEGVAVGQHTRFVISVISILPAPEPRPKPSR
ncbi:MAG TPA: hypothetical protein VHW71_01985 [Steroidobacteraceae bacterium]|jgi:hypothetical protein|nr:hypothetical protein [Steroidobacteraceae bacterium]